MIRILKAALFTLLLIGPTLVWSATSTARIVFARGTVTAIDEITLMPRLLRKDSRVEVGETVVTGPKGLAQLVFADKSLLYLRANSRVKIEAFHFEPDAPEKDSQVIKHIQGAMRSLTGAVGKRNPGNVSIETRSGTIGIRGTALEIADEGGGQRVTFDFGEGYVTNEGGKLPLQKGTSAQVGGQATQAKLIDFLRSETDPALIAEKLNRMSPEEIEQWVAQQCAVLPAGEAILTLGMEGQAPGKDSDKLAATSGGLTSCLALEEMSDLLTSATLLHTETAEKFMRSAVKGGVNVAIALESVMRGLEGADPSILDKVITGALKLGITQEQAQQVLQRLQNEGICR